MPLHRFDKISTSHVQASMQLLWRHMGNTRLSFIEISSKIWNHLIVLKKSFNCVKRNHALSSYCIACSILIMMVRLTIKEEGGYQCEPIFDLTNWYKTKLSNKTHTHIGGRYQFLRFLKRWHWLEDFQIRSHISQIEVTKHKRLNCVSSHFPFL